MVLNVIIKNEHEESSQETAILKNYASEGISYHFISMQRAEPMQFSDMVCTQPA